VPCQYPCRTHQTSIRPLFNHLEVVTGHSLPVVLLYKLQDNRQHMHLNAHAEQIQGLLYESIAGVRASGVDVSAQ
jgi:hypothetical protein